ncbi:YybH family protein [Methylotenera versatilis]|uniref:YybH family protein n=1 Tax=Methylotenera versatilis TaxID=1055487 RepID=UPI0006467252|nr:SgcJ/EcaC family oxidoreductase [Methylotenera versatilis]
MKNLLSSTCVSLLLTLGLSTSAVAGDSNIKSIVESANTAWNQALNTGNAKALSNQYVENATLSPGDGKVLVGRTEIESLFKSFVANGVHNHTLEVVNVGGSGNMIYQISKWSANGAEANGKVPAFGGITTSVLIKGADGKWLTQSQVWNVAN